MSITGILLLRAQRLYSAYTWTVCLKYCAMQLVNNLYVQILLTVCTLSVTSPFTHDHIKCRHMQMILLLHLLMVKVGVHPVINDDICGVVYYMWNP